jgi:hypothetical protein
MTRDDLTLSDWLELAPGFIVKLQCDDHRQIATQCNATTRNATPFNELWIRVLLSTHQSTIHWQKACVGKEWMLDTLIDSMEGHMGTWKDGHTIQSLRASFLEGEDDVTALAHVAFGHLTSLA